MGLADWERRELFSYGRKVLGKNAGGLIAKLYKKEGQACLARRIIETAATKTSPREYIGAILRAADSP